MPNAFDILKESGVNNMKYTAFLFLLFFIQTISAQTKNPINEEALKNTQDMMTNPSQRAEAIGGNAKAKEVDRMVNDLMGENSEEMYKAAAKDFMPYIVKMSDGDPKKMNEIMTQAMRNPAAFAESLPPELKQKISDLAAKAKKPAQPEQPKLKP